MKLRAEQLNGQLGKGLAPIYLIHGDEPLQAMEAADAVRAAARDRHYDEREVLNVEPGFDWSALDAAAHSGSLFSSRRLIELRLEDQKPGEAGSKALTGYAARPPADTVLLVLCGKLDAGAQKSRWFGTLDQAGVTVQVWPLDGRRLTGWIETRMRDRGLRPDAEAVRLLAARVEGNLLAAAQEIDKLALLCGVGPVDAEQVLAAVGDSARYSIFELAEAALAARPERVTRIVHGLRAEGVEPVLAAWALAREIRLLDQLHHARAGGGDLASAMRQYKVWDKRKPLLTRALDRLPAPATRRLLVDCARLDRVIKGLEPAAPWDELLLLALALAGRRVLSPPP